MKVYIKRKTTLLHWYRLLFENHCQNWYQSQLACNKQSSPLYTVAEWWIYLEQFQHSLHNLGNLFDTLQGDSLQLLANSIVLMLILFQISLGERSYRIFLHLKLSLKTQLSTLHYWGFVHKISGWDHLLHSSRVYLC